MKNIFRPQYANRSVLPAMFTAGIYLFLCCLAMADVSDPDPEKDLIKRSLFGYTNLMSVRPGETIDFKVSDYQLVEGPYQAQLVRINYRGGVTPETSFTDEELDAHFNGSYEGREQKIHPGSFVEIADSSALKAPTISIALASLNDRARFDTIV